MFITKAEKEEMRILIRTLQSRVKELELRLSVLEPLRLKQKPAIFRTAEAPWGYKKDGSPKKRPGRPIPTMKVGQP